MIMADEWWSGQELFQRYQFLFQNQNTHIFSSAYCFWQQMMYIELNNDDDDDDDWDDDVDDDDDGRLKQTNPFIYTSLSQGH